MTVCELLSDESKWTKGQSIGTNIRGESCYCLLGAIRYCYGFDEDIGRAVKKAFQAIKLLGWRGVTHLVGFNDRTSTTFADIRRVIEAAGI